AAADTSGSAFIARAQRARRLKRTHVAAAKLASVGNILAVGSRTEARHVMSDAARREVHRGDTRPTTCAEHLIRTRRDDVRCALAMQHVAGVAELVSVVVTALVVGPSFIAVDRLFAILREARDLVAIESDALSAVLALGVGHDLAFGRHEFLRMKPAAGVHDEI